MSFFVLILSIILAAIIIVLFFRAWRRPAGEGLNVSPPLPPKRPDTEFAAEIWPSVSVPPAPAGQMAPELPRRYGEDRLVLLARDPHWLFAYWEVSATKQEEFQARYGPEAWQTSRPVLRLYDVTGIKFEGYNANSYVDIPINEEADNWYLEVGQPNRTFCVDLGRLLPTGEFVMLLRSNLAHTPRAALSELCDEEWMWIEGVYRSMLRYQFGISSPLLFEEIAARMGKEVIPVGIGSPVILPPVRK